MCVVENEIAIDRAADERVVSIVVDVVISVNRLHSRIANLQLDLVGGKPRQANRAGRSSPLRHDNQIVAVGITSIEIAGRDVKSIVAVIEVGNEIIAAVGAELENLAVVGADEGVIAHAAMERDFRTAGIDDEIVAAAAECRNAVAEGRDGVV